MKRLLLLLIMFVGLQAADSGQKVPNQLSVKSQEKLEPQVEQVRPVTDATVENAPENVSEDEGDETSDVSDQESPASEDSNNNADGEEELSGDFVESFNDLATEPSEV